MILALFFTPYPPRIRPPTAATTRITRTVAQGSERTRWRTRSLPYAHARTSHVRDRRRDRALREDPRSLLTYATPYPPRIRPPTAATTRITRTVAQGSERTRWRTRSLPYAHARTSHVRLYGRAASGGVLDARATVFEHRNLHPSHPLPPILEPEDPGTTGTLARRRPAPLQREPLDRKRAKQTPPKNHGK